VTFPTWRGNLNPVDSLVGTFVAKRDISNYGDSYYLVVRCEGKWAAQLVEEQTFAVAVELWHEAELELYQQVAVVLNA
jgi:hypothetical protein